MPDTEFTPTTDNVRVSYGVAAGFPVMSVPERGRAFQRWLAAHSASVRAAALDEAAEVAIRYGTAPARDARDRITADDIAFRIQALKEEKK